MALKLNPPSDFIRPPKQESKVLLPPSSFKKTSPDRRVLKKDLVKSQASQDDSQNANHSPLKDQTKNDGEDPWKSLALASRKLEELKEQNDELKRSQQNKQGQHDSHKDPSVLPTATHPPLPLHQQPLTNPVSAVRPSLPPHQASGPLPQHPASYPLPLPHHAVSDHAQFLHLRHTADILTRQATEVAQLQTELDSTRTRSTKEIGELKERLRQVEGDKMEEVAELTARVRSQQLTYNKKIEALQQSHTDENDTLKQKCLRLEQSMKTLHSTHEADIKELQSRLTSEQATHKHDVAEFKEQLRCKHEETNSLNRIVSQLRTYFGEVKQVEETASKWKQQQHHLETRIIELDKECDNLQSTVQLMNIRLSSTNEMLAIQESEVAKGKLDGIEDSKITHGLLTRWREKVFSLMVQQKSQDIVIQKDAKDQRNMMTELENKAASAHNQCLMLEHSIADKEAQLQMERGKVENLTEELQSMRQVCSAMEAELQNNEESMRALSLVMNRFQDWHHSQEEKMQTMVTKLGGFEQRVQFATSRIDVLKGLLARKDALLNVQLEGRQLRNISVSATVDASTSPDVNDTIQPTDARISYADLVVEFDKVRKERDQLAERIKTDAKFFEETIQTMRQKLESNAAEADERSSILENTIEEMTQKIECKESDLDKKLTSLVEATDTIDRLKIDMAKLQVGADKASKDRCQIIEVQYRGQLTEMEQRLNEARREHAKAVVSLRQFERQQSREKDRSAEMLTLQEEQNRLENGRLTSQLKDLERDKNLLMATLRQEGLINQYKAQRNATRKLPPDKPSQVLKTTSAADGRVVQKDSLITMIADVKALSEQVLQDEDKENTGYLGS